jgi:hypothetical protein
LTRHSREAGFSPAPPGDQLRDGSLHLLLHFVPHYPAPVACVVGTRAGVERADACAR